jgi:hypothetical protein
VLLFPQLRACYPPPNWTYPDHPELLLLVRLLVLLLVRVR